MKNPFAIVYGRLPFARQSGVALVIVLALIVLLLGLVVAFFSQSVLQQQISKSSASQTAVDLLAQGAIHTIVGDLKQEIVNGSDKSEIPEDTSGSKLFFIDRRSSARRLRVRFLRKRRLELVTVFLI